MDKDGEKVKVICLGDSAVGKSKYVLICLFEAVQFHKLEFLRKIWLRKIPNK